LSGARWPVTGRRKPEEGEGQLAWSMGHGGRQTAKGMERGGDLTTG